MEHFRPALAGTLLIAAVAAIAGYLLGHHRPPGREVATPRSFASGAFALRAPGQWREIRELDVPGLVLKDRLVLSPSKRSRAALIVGLAPADDDSLLSPPVRRRAGLVAPADTVRLGSLEALHYRHLRGLGDAGAVDLYASPVHGGALTAVCVAGDAGFLRSCRSAVATLRLTRGVSYKLGEDVPFRRALDRALLVLNTKRALGAAAMQRSGNGAAQASAADSVARAFQAAAQHVGDASHNPTSHSSRGALVLALHEAAAAWRRLARAAAGGSVERYELARLLVRSSESWLGVLTRTIVAPGGGSVSAQPAPSPTAGPLPTASPPPDSQPCSPTHARFANVDVTGRGLVRICVSSDRTSLLVKNISHLVVRVRHDGRATPVRDAAGDLSAQAVRSVAPTSCAATSCTLPPGASVRLDGTTTAPTFTPVIEDSVSAVIAAGVAGEVESRLRPYPQRRPRQVIACAEGVKKTIESRNEEEIALNTVIEGRGCKKLITDVLGTEDAAKRQSFARDVLKRVDGFAGEPLEEGLLVAIKTGFRALR
jgi:hypothetical protein